MGWGWGRGQAPLQGEAVSEDPPCCGQRRGAAGALDLGGPGDAGTSVGWACPCSHLLLPQAWAQAPVVLCGGIWCQGLEGPRLAGLSLSPLVQGWGQERQKEPSTKCGAMAPPAGASMLLPSRVPWPPWVLRVGGHLARGWRWRLPRRDRHPGDCSLAISPSRSPSHSRSTCGGLLTPCPPPRAGLLWLPLGQ